jgi:serine protease inhibitor
LEGHYDLPWPLTNMGIDNIFSPERANLSGLTKAAIPSEQNLYVSTAIHKTNFQTDEEGRREQLPHLLGFYC